MTELKLPELGENITQGTVTKILVKVGDTIKKGQGILEIETDKAVVEVPSDSDGVIKEILIKSGTVIKAGQPIFKIEGGESAAPSAAPAAKAEVPAAKAEAPAAKTEAPAAKAEPPATQAQPLPTGGHDFSRVPMQAAEQVSIEGESPAYGRDPAKGGDTPGKQPSAKPPAVTVTTVTTGPIPARKDIPAAPSVRLLARELGIDIAQVAGSGPGGRISANDVKAYCKILNTTRPAGGGMGTAPQPLPDFTKWGTVRREAMSNVRKKTAEHVSNAWGSIPHVTQFDKADITELEKFRKTISGTKKKISVTPFIVKVVAGALKKFPQFNSSIDMTTQEIILKDYVNIGVAVDTDRGLLVPVLKNVDKMSILQIADELAAMAERARLRKTTIEEMQGGCFTISNLGGIGGSSFTPIVNWPQVAILGVSRGSMESVYIDGNFVPRLMLPLSLSYDHRVVDGADGARFIRWVCEAIQQPFLLETST